MVLRIIQTIMTLIGFVYVSYSQDCSEFITIDEDNNTHEKQYSGKDFIDIKDNGDTTLQLLTMLSNDHATLILSLTALKDIKCVDPTDEIDFTFADNSKYSATGNQDFNCNGAFSIYFGDFKKNDGLLNLLLSKKVISIRLYCRAGILNVPLTSENNEELFGEMNCLNRYLKR
jgi:hypothetical protein